MFGGSESVSLRSGATLRCGDLFVELEHAPERIERVTLMRPLSGVGGHELVVSPDQRLAALFVYSGQSEQGYELFELAPSLRHAGGLPYVHGQGDAPVFSADSRWLVMAVTGGWTVRETGEHAEDVLDPDARGTVLLDWAQLYVQRVPDGAVEHVAIGTEVSRAADPDALFAWSLHGCVSVVGDERVAITLPSGGRLEIDLPPRGSVTTP